LQNGRELRSVSEGSGGFLPRIPVSLEQLDLLLIEELRPGRFVVMVFTFKALDIYF
jgi:hypothetical protein